MSKWKAQAKARRKAQRAAYEDRITQRKAGTYVAPVKMTNDLYQEPEYNKPIKAKFTWRCVI